MWLVSLLLICPATALAQDGDEPEFGAVAEIDPPQDGNEDEIEAEEARTAAGAFGDPFRALDLRPGTLALRSGTPFLHVRGAPPSGTVYYYDGIQLPAIGHLAAGPSVIHAAAIERVRFYRAVAPARYGRLSGAVVAAEPSEPEERLAADLELRVVDVGGLVEVPVGPRFVIAGRYGYPGPILSAVESETTIAYWDYLLRAEVPTSGDDRFELISLGSFDVLDQPPWVDDASDRGDMELEFHRIELRYIRERRNFELGAALRFGADHSRLGRAMETRVTSVGSRVWAEHRDDDNLRFRVGADFLGSAGELDDPSGVIEGPFGQIPVDLPLYADVPARSVGGVYSELEFRPAKKLELSLGIRSDVWLAAGDAQWAIDPRVRATWFASEDIRMHAGVGLAHQPAVYLFPLPGLTETAIDRGLQRAVQSDVGVTIDLPQAMRLEFGLFLNHFSDLLLPEAMWGWQRGGCARIFCGDATPGRSDVLSWGAEFFLEREISERMSGTLSYTLSWADAVDALDQSFTPHFDVRHLLALGLRVEIVTGLFASTRIGLRSGFMASAPFERGIYQQRLPPFFRADARIGYRWSPDWGRVSVYLEWMNLTLSEEPIDIQCVRDEPEGPCKVVDAPAVFFPNLGLRVQL